MKITIIGAGMGQSEYLFPAAYSAIHQGDLVLGAKRLIDALAPATAELVPTISPQEIAEKIENSSKENAVILMSGDVGFYSGTTKLLPLLAAYEVTVIPGLSCVQMFGAKIKKPWQSWHLCSAHGTDCNIVSLVARNKETFFLTGGRWTVSEICKHLTQWGLGHLDVWVGENLATETERILYACAGDCALQEFSSLSVCLISNPQAKQQGYCAIPDDGFIRGNIPMTKQEIRSVAVAKLQISDTDVVYDIGAGTGSVSVEIAKCAYRGKVYAIEREEEGCSLITQNAVKHLADNIYCVCGHAPQALEELPPPHAAFIGGSGGNMDEIFKLLLRKNPKIRLVITAVTLETLGEITRLFASLPLKNQEIVQISISRSKEVGGYHMMMGQNPIFIASAEGI